MPAAPGSLQMFVQTDNSRAEFSPIHRLSCNLLIQLASATRLTSFMP